MDSELLSIIACPRCKGALTLITEETGLHCAHCNGVYPVIEDIPVLLPEEMIAQQEWEAGKRSSLSPS